VDQSVFYDLVENGVFEAKWAIVGKKDFQWSGPLF